MDAVREAGGAVFAITSEPQTLAGEARASWELDFPVVGDPHHEIADTCRERGWLALFVNERTDELRRAAELQGTNARYLYVYAVALNSLGQSDAAIDLLLRGKDDFPADFDIHWALATMLRDVGRADAAKEIAENLAVRYPEVQQVQTLTNSLQ